jgi:hypothetical protein
MRHRPVLTARPASGRALEYVPCPLEIRSRRRRAPAPGFPEDRLCGPAEFFRTLFMMRWTARLRVSLKAAMIASLTWSGSNSLWRAPLCNSGFALDRDYRITADIRNQPLASQRGQNRQTRGTAHCGWQAHRAERPRGAFQCEALHRCQFVRNYRALLAELPDANI